MKYRAEIDGLRALAVLPVVFYHAGFSGVFPGGFIGVDVFFVISGYLITNILVSELNAGGASILTFYERRIRRIFPPLFCVMIVSTLLAAGVLLSNEFNDYGRSLFFATFFLSNHYFLADTGYFAGPSEVKPLLHMWSLAVEEQFYIVFPLVLYALNALAWGRRLGVTLGLFVCSFILCILLTSTHPEAAFYLAPVRAWELLAGSILAMLPRRYAASQLLPTSVLNVLGLAGFGAICLGIITYSTAIPFPGIAALLPVLGTAAILYTTADKQTLTGRFLSLAPLRFVGMISYSLYLWHWPIFVFYRFWRIEHPSLAETWGLIALAGVMATLSWRFVEQPFRQRMLMRTRRSALGSGAIAMVCTAALAATIAVKDGFPGRYPDEVIETLAAQNDTWAREGCVPADPKDQRSINVCPINKGVPARPADFAVWGDSHAGALLAGFDVASDMTERNGVSLSNVGCPPLLTVERTGIATCKKAAAAIIAYLADTPTLRDIYLVSRWTYYVNGQAMGRTADTNVYLQDTQTHTLSFAENAAVVERGLDQTLSALKQMGRRIHIVIQLPESFHNVPANMARNFWLGRNVDLRTPRVAHTNYAAQTTALLEAARKRHGVTLVSLISYMCSEVLCEVADGIQPRYRDNNHITNRAAAQIGPMLAPSLASDSSPIMD